MNQDKTENKRPKLFLGKPLSLEAEAKLFKMVGTPPPSPLKEVKNNSTPKKTRDSKSVKKSEKDSSNTQDKNDNNDQNKTKSKWQKKPLSHDDQQKLERYRKIKTAVKWLCETFPKCFNTDAPKPLQLRIEAEIFPLLEGKESPPSKKAIREAIGFYSKGYSYLEAVAKSDKRFDINGLPVSDIDEAHKTYAQEIIAKKNAERDAARLRRQERQEWKKPITLEP